MAKPAMGRALRLFALLASFVMSCTITVPGGDRGGTATASAGTIVDPTFGEFGDYMARLVGYYNKGSFVAEDGSTIANPAGLANRITYWELWNEPDWWSIACPAKGNPNITARQYLTMWNTTAPRMLAVDPSIKLVGPSVASASGNNSGNYIALLMAGATPKPDVVSFHGYGGWIDSQSDAFLFGGGC